MKNKKPPQTAANKQLQAALAETKGTKKSWNQHSKVAPKEERTGQDGFVYDSKTEYQRYCHLDLLKRGGQITELRRQVTFELRWKQGGEPAIMVFTNHYGGEPAIMVGKNRDKVSVYTPDFVYKNKAGDLIIEDVKGYRDENSKFRIRVFESLYNVDVVIVKKENNHWITEA